MTEPETGRRSGGLFNDVVRLFVRPGDLFAELHRTNRAAAALFVLLLAHLLYAGLVLLTGVPDYEIAAQSEKEIARTAEQLKGDENEQELTAKIEALEKKAVFDRLFTRVALLAGAPLGLLAGVGLVSSALFLAVALWGSAKADFAQLAGVAVFASFVTVPQLLVRLVLIARLHALRADTSAAALLPSPRPALLGAFLLLRRLDPFEVWYWALVGFGLWKTGQMSGRRALAVAVVLALLAALALSCLDLRVLAEYRVDPQADR